MEVDHVIPVARGGTDVFENLITSCRECNSGKSAKLIERFTNGHTKESWRENIRERRVERLKERRAEIEVVVRCWAECRNARSVSEYDSEAIYRFVEIYDPAWIKAAIRIATRQQRNNYVKYVAGILKNWAATGPPEYVANPEKALDDALEQKKYLVSVAQSLVTCPYSPECGEGVFRELRLEGVLRSPRGPSGPWRALRRVPLRAAL